MASKIQDAMEHHPIANRGTGADFEKQICAKAPNKQEYLQLVSKFIMRIKAPPQQGSIMHQQQQMQQQQQQH